MIKCPRPKYKVGDMVYSYQNPTVKRKIRQFREADEYCIYRYKLELRRKDGTTHRSKWINEKSLSKRRKRK